METSPSDAAPKTAAAGAATSRSTPTAAATAAPATFTPLFGGAKIVLAETPKAVTPQPNLRRRGDPRSKRPAEDPL